ncbi:sigma factor [Sphingomonas morindae]|uniref:Sigma-70 family RNA polymerase sigma factor n=1 Tax=Sphingomonas morindae TaxID=1541170 RepID=A0ABY4X566_9SPHN|nr:sigma factor [Sphingomonas morindae]USI72011.1 sigma-70 family RNA polymerase sigma factor [Sphingomonas morindae]
MIMSKTTVAIEDAVTSLRAAKEAHGPAPSPRQRLAEDRLFARILTLLAPRIRHFIRQYGLGGHWEDAEQVCAIAVHRAIETYDPERARFTTFVNWLIRGELQGLRFRLMTDQRPSARKVAATTVSLHALTQTSDDAGPGELLIEDEEALAQTEADASAYLADNAMRAMIDSYVAHLRAIGIAQLSRRPRRPGTTPPTEKRPRLKVNSIDPEELRQLEERLHRNRALVEQRIFELSPIEKSEEDGAITKERMRQIAKRAARTIATIAQQDPRFAIMVDSATPPAPDQHQSPAPAAPPQRPGAPRGRDPAPEDHAVRLCEGDAGERTSRALH